MKISSMKSLETEKTIAYIVGVSEEDMEELLDFVQEDIEEEKDVEHLYPYVFSCLAETLKIPIIPDKRADGLIVTQDEIYIDDYEINYFLLFSSIRTTAFFQMLTQKVLSGYKNVVWMDKPIDQIYDQIKDNNTSIKSSTKEEQFLQKLNELYGILKNQIENQAEDNPEPDIYFYELPHLTTLLHIPACQGQVLEDYNGNLYLASPQILHDYLNLGNPSSSTKIIMEDVNELYQSLEI